jgi:ParB-like chromosome segregation protein Spo0J
VQIAGSLAASPNVESIEVWPIDRPRDSAANARVHPDKQILELRSSLREYGQVWPILVREDDEIIAGHGRRVAAKLEGFTEIKVLVARGWTEQQCRAFALLDNRIPLNADWDAAKLAKELASLRDDGVKLLDIGFSKGDLARLLPTAEAAARREAAMQSFQPVYQVLIECADEHEQLRVLTKLQEDGINCRALIA